MVKPASSPALAALSLSMLLSSLGTSIANVGLPDFARAFGASVQQVQWIVVAYLVAVTSLIVGAGRLGDVTGRRRLLLAGILLFSIASSLCSAAPTLGLLIAARAAQGAGAALMMAMTLALVGGIVPKDRMGRAMGLLGTMSAIGTALGPALGGALIAASGWRTLFLINLPIGALAFLLAIRHLPADRGKAEGERAGFDLPGTLLLALTLGAYALAMTAGRGFGPINAALLAATGLGAGLFVLRQARAASPLIGWAALDQAGLKASLAAGALVSTVMMATLVVGPFYLSLSLGLETAAVGLAMSAGPLAAALAAVPAGRLADRIGARRTARIGLAAIGGGCVLVGLAPAALGVFGYVGPMTAVVCGYALFQTANNSAVMADVAPERRGLVSGLLNLSRNLGLVTGASLMGAIFAAASGMAEPADAPPAAIATGLQATFAVAAALAAAAMAVMAAGRRSVAASVSP
ncbi:MAG TPA: MFS transporter [Allosphingosinicella sp.]|jgi:MFS family permease